MNGSHIEKERERGREKESKRRVEQVHVEAIEGRISSAGVTVHQIAPVA